MSNSIKSVRVRSAKKDLIISIVLALPVFILEMGSHLIPAFHMWIMDTIGQYNSWLLQFALTTLVLVFQVAVFIKRDSSPVAFGTRYELASGSWNLGCLQFLGRSNLYAACVTTRHGQCLL